MFLNLVLGLLLIYASYLDFRYRIIPNKLCLVILLSSYISSLLQTNYIISLQSALIVILASLLLFYFKVVAAGDGKLAAALAAALLPEQLPNAVILTLLTGGVLAVFYLIKDRLILKKKPGEDRGLPYGIAISFGFYLTILANSI